MKDWKKDIVFIGHFALDNIIVRNRRSKSQSLGGGVTYGSLSAYHYNPKANIGIISIVGKKFDEENFSIFKDTKIDLRGIIRDGKETTKYLIDYHETGRNLRLISKARDFEIKDIEFPIDFFPAKAVHLTPIADEFSSDFLHKLADHSITNNSIIGIDVQGLIRDFDKEGNLIMKKNSTIRPLIFKMLQKFGSRMFFKASDKEALAVTEHTQNELIESTELLGETGAYIFTTLGDKGLYFSAPGHPVVHFNAYCPKRREDETGAGDCFMAILLLELSKLLPEERTYKKISEIIRIASAGSSFLIEEKGPNGFQSKNTILSRINPQNEIRNEFINHN